MRVDVISIFPEMFRAVLGESIIKRAQEQGLLELVIRDLREHTRDKRRTVDDRPYGGGPGMIMRVEPLVEAVEAVRTELGEKQPRRQVILMSPRGRRMSDALAQELAGFDQLTVLCGHYEGVDERVRDLVVDQEISIGDYVLTGGELPAMVLIDCVARFLPGVLGNEQATEDESFSNGLLEYPQYTRPPMFRDQTVPEVLLSGDHERIAAWRKLQALNRTLEARPDLAGRRKTSQPKE